MEQLLEEIAEVAVVAQLVDGLHEGVLVLTSDHNAVSQLDMFRPTHVDRPIIH